MNIILLGPPASGKGTQGELLAEKLGLPRLSVGAILRRTREEGGKKAAEIDKYMLKGHNVPAKLLFEIITPWFAQHKEGFILDNLIRNLDQLKEFKKFLKKNKITINRVFHLNVSEEESIKRVRRRYVEKSKTSQIRPDDEEEVIKTRIKEGYQKEIRPILAFFKKMGVLVEINGEQSKEKVHEEIELHLKGAADTAPEGIKR